MTSTWIKINGTGSNHNFQLRKFVDDLQAVVDDAARLKAVYDQAAAGSDWASLALMLDVTEADAQAIYNTLGSANTELHATFITQMLGRLG